MNGVAVSETNRSRQQGVGGEQEVKIVVFSTTGETSDFVTIGANFFLCQAFEYAVAGRDVGVCCEQCVVLSGADRVDCELPRATLATLPIRKGYWRSSNESLEIHSCLHVDACAGARWAFSSDDFCQGEYNGPCECERFVPYWRPRHLGWQLRASLTRSTDACQVPSTQAFRLLFTACSISKTVKD